MSTTVTVEDPCATLPAASTAVHVSLVVPSATTIAFPGVPKSQLTLTAPDPPLVCGAGGVTVADSLLVASAVMGANIANCSVSLPEPPPPQPARLSASSVAPTRTRSVGRLEPCTSEQSAERRGAERGNEVRGIVDIVRFSMVLAGTALAASPGGTELKIRTGQAGKRISRQGLW